MYNRQIERILEFTSLQQRNPFNNIRLIVFGYRKFEKYKSKEFLDKRCLVWLWRKIRLKSCWYEWRYLQEERTGKYMEKWQYYERVLFTKRGTSELSNLYSAPLKKENSISKQFVRLLSDRGETENICSSNECSEAGHCDSRGVEKSSKIECSTGKESGGDMGSRLVWVSKGINSEMKVCKRRNITILSTTQYKKKTKRTLHSSIKTKSALMSTGEM